MKKITSTLIAAIMLIMALASIPVQAASWPSLSSSAYCEFTSPKQINVYKDSNFSTRGTSSPEKAYNAYISKNDVCKMYKITSSYIQVQYPTSSGNRVGYIKRADLLNVSSPSEQVTSNGSATTYVSAGGNSYGSVAKGDSVYACGTTSGYTAVIYTAKSGQRAYKYGWVKTSDYNSSIKGTTTTSTSKTKIWPVGGNGGTDANNWYKYSDGSYHSGTDIAAPAGTAVYATYSGTVDTAKTLTNSYGKHVIIKSTVNSKTVYIYYCHLSSYSVKQGDTVSAGQQIGTVGKTGHATGNHLHYEVRDSNKRQGNLSNPNLNPHNYLP